MTWHCKRCKVSYDDKPEQVMMDRDQFGRVWFPCCFGNSVDGDTFDPALDGKRLGPQMIRVLRSMLDQKWRTLAEIKEITTDPEASISARLRDVRKRWGEGAMESRRRASAGLESGLWEFRVNLPEGTEL
jgi:hypothetical protein